LLYADVSAEVSRNNFGARAEIRGREGRFRDFYRSDVWLQEGYAFLETGLGEVRVGKLERRLGLTDETFGGNLFSLNGVTRNPDWGAGFTGEQRFGWNSLDYWVGFFGQNDRVSWEEDGRGLESDPGATLREAGQARVRYKVNGGLWTLRPGISASTSSV